jgi:hypothetical protein
MLREMRQVTIGLGDLH